MKYNIKDNIFKLKDIENINSLNNSLTRKINPFFKKLNKTIKNKNWKKINKNKNKLNNIRHKIVDNIIFNSETYSKNTFNKKIKIYKTGSNKISSDIDLQISLNIANKWTYKELNTLILFINNKINKKNNKLHIDINKQFDINFYLPTIFYHISSIKYLDKLNKKFYIKKNNNIYSLCLKPNFDISQKKIETFLLKDSIKIFYNEEKNYKKYLSLYKNISKLLENITNLMISNKDNNKMLLKLNSINCKGSDMYFSINTIIYVVWHLQLKNKIPINDLKYIVIPSFIENYIRFKSTNNPKYKYRYIKSLKIIKKYDTKILFNNILSKLKNYDFNKKDKNSICKINKNSVKILKSIPYFKV